MSIRGDIMIQLEKIESLELNSSNLKKARKDLQDILRFLLNAVSELRGDNKDA